MIFFLLRECITPEPKNQSPGLTIFLLVPIIVGQFINTENRRRHDTSLEQLSARMRQGEDIPLSDTARIALALSIPSILEQLVVTAMEYIDAAMVGHIGAEATAAIGIVSSSTWLLHGILVGLYTAFSIQIAQYLGAKARRKGIGNGTDGHHFVGGPGRTADGDRRTHRLPGFSDTGSCRLTSMTWLKDICASSY